MLRVLLLGANGLPLQVTDTGQIDSVDTGQTVAESVQFDGRFDNAVLTGLYGNILLPVLVDDNGNIL